ncbi:MAG TPA: PilZ domain-containing protein [Terriglobia bacterium]|nr:PilZ domain-containing protein [Terriglobia bacterium]
MTEKRKFPRIPLLAPEEDAVLISMNNGKHFAAKLVDLSRGGVMMFTDDPSAWLEIGGPYKLYFQSRGEMFHLEGTLVRTDTQFLAFQFFNVTDLDIAELRRKLAQMEMLNARLLIRQ